MSDTTTDTGFISGIQYKSGRSIFCRRLPMRGEFTETPCLAHTWPDEESAADAAKQLITYFQIRNKDAIKIFTLHTTTERAGLTSMKLLDQLQ